MTPSLMMVVITNSWDAEHRNGNVNWTRVGRSEGDIFTLVNLGSGFCHWTEKTLL
jgi:hypothetical protein